MQWNVWFFISFSWKSTNTFYALWITCSAALTNMVNNFFVKVARVCHSKLGFTNWFFYNLILLIELCKIQLLNWEKVLLFPRNQVICLKNWKLWQAPTTIEWYFLLKFCTLFLFNNVYKGVFEIFFTLFRFWVINKKCKKRECRNQGFFNFANSRSMQNKKNPKDTFVDIGK